MKRITFVLLILLSASFAGCGSIAGGIGGLVGGAVGGEIKKSYKEETNKSSEPRSQGDTIPTETKSAAPARV